MWKIAAHTVGLHTILISAILDCTLLIFYVSMLFALLFLLVHLHRCLALNSEQQFVLCWATMLICLEIDECLSYLLFFSEGRDS